MTTVAQRRPSTLDLSLARGALEVKTFFRERDAVLFTFAFPAVLLLLLGFIMSGVIPDDSPAPDITAGQLLTAGMIAAGIGSTSFVNLAIGITGDREDGTLRRIRCVPMPPIAYFAGKVVLVVVTTVIEIAIVLTVGVLAFGVRLPTDPLRWLTLAWVTLLGVIACSLLGVAMSSVPRSVRSAAPVVNLPFLVLQFVSGIFVVPTTALPTFLQYLGAVFPLKWMAQGFRSALLPDQAVALEPALNWEHGRTALILGLWCAAGLVLCLTTFRWRSRKDG